MKSCSVCVLWSPSDAQREDGLSLLNRDSEQASPTARTFLYEG